MRLLIKQYLQDNWLKLLSFAIVMIAMAVPRGLGLDRFATPDEPKWLTRSANFFLALAQRDFENTYQKEHPGVTVMWASAAGFLRQYPQYVNQGPGQQERPQKFKRYLDNRNLEAINLLEAGRVFVVIGILITLALAYWSAIKLFGLLTAFVGFLLIAFDPFSIALSRLLHLDGLVSALMLLSLLAMMNYLYSGRHPADLILSAIAAGLGWLTKSPSLFLLPFFTLLAVIELLRSWRQQGQFRKGSIWRATWPILAWTGMSALIFVIFFPSMWVQPVYTLNEIFIKAWFYASEGHNSATFFNGIIFPSNVDDWRFYPLSYLWRTTPVTLAGLLLLLLVFILRRRIVFSKAQQRVALVMGLFVILYTVFMTLGGKKFDRYLLPVFAPLDLLAAMGWVTILANALNAVLSTRPGAKYSQFIKLSLAAFFGAIFVWQVWGTMQTYPYFFDYYNQLMGGSKKAPQVMMIGWGEGLDEAARYLNAKPDAENAKVMSWYQDGPFSYFFKGTTIQEDFPTDPQDLPRADYAVIYIHQWQRQLPSREFLEYFDQRQPEHTIWINDLPYAYIYRME